MRKFALPAIASLGLIALVLSTPAKGSVDPKVADQLKKIAAALESGDETAAKKMAGDLAKQIEALDEVMDAFKPRNKKGIGVGSVPGASLPDGIDLKVTSLARDSITKAQLEKEATALKEAGYIIAAVSLVTDAKPPEKFTPKQTKKEWTELVDVMKTQSIALAQAAKAGNAADVKTTASKLVSSCANCHATFRDQ